MGKSLKDKQKKCIRQIICLQVGAFSLTSLVEFNSNSIFFYQKYSMFFELGVNLLGKLLWSHFVAPSIATNCELYRMVLISVRNSPTVSRGLLLQNGCLLFRCS